MKSARERSGPRGKCRVVPGRDAKLTEAAMAAAQERRRDAAEYRGLTLYCVFTYFHRIPSTFHKIQRLYKGRRDGVPRTLRRHFMPLNFRDKDFSPLPAVRLESFAFPLFFERIVRGEGRDSAARRKKERLPGFRRISISSVSPRAPLCRSCPVIAIKSDEGAGYTVLTFRFRFQSRVSPIRRTL